ncbi:sensor histidine kinase [Parasediminibacterium paludis]|uniref:Sensor histidine kinase n=1 Tax=Parasediminibacterium paludis TaxID=908966 RepID=A0ABV8PW22_9BACT
MAFSNGLHELTKDSIFTPVLYNKEVITASSLLYIYNKTYATTFNNGLFIIDKNGIRRKSMEDGLLSNKILKIKQINNQLFILEQKNIQIFDIHSEKIIKTIALPTEKSSVIYDLWQEDSLIYLSSNKGLYKLNIKNVNDVIIPDNYILTITSDTSVFSPTQPIQLPYSQNNIQFKVVSPSFIYPEYTYFKYRILGNNDTTWQQTTSNESNISFAALKPGDYTFEAYAVNFQNTSGKTLRYQFTILKPWWQQWWFITVIFLSIISGLYYIITLRLKAIDRKNSAVLEKIALTSELRKSQLSTIVAQMNPHFIFNTLNTIQGLIYKNDKNSSTRYIGKFSELVRDILKNSNQEVISLEEEISHLSTYLELEKMRFEDDLHITLTVDESLDKTNIMLPPILVQPYIENAIFHGLFHKKGEKNLVIKFMKSQRDNYLEITIDDNGIGRAMSQQLNSQRRKHESFAISAIERRIHLLNQNLNRKIEIDIIDKVDNSQNAAGTNVTISIPINSI